MTTDIELELDSDEALIERARQGNREAYNELLARHRGRAFAWAKQITSDHHLAEDIVQEALVRAFLKLGTMTDLTKFLPWLRTIVRNQAMMKLRRGGPHGREKPFPPLRDSATSASEGAEPDWRDLDTVLRHYAKRAGTDNGTDSAASGAESPLAEWLPAVVKALGPRERDVFEKHFYGQLSPQEIADHWNTNVNTIHKALSRIRRKAEDTRIELDIRSRIRSHIDARGGGKRVVLAKPGLADEPPVHPGAAFPNALYHILRSLGRPVTMAEATGYTGYAFVLNVRRSTIGAESPMIWDWDTFLSNALLNLGFHSRYVDYQHYKNAGSSPHKTRNLLFTLDMIRDSIDRGMPALLSSAISYDLAVVYGYDDEKQTLYVADPQSCEQISYSSLYSGSPKIDKAISRELYAFVFDGELDDDRRLPEHRLVRLLERIVRHSDGDDPTFMPCAGGLRAYDEWIAAFESGTIEPLGNASNLNLYGWFREQAVSFWKERIGEYDGRRPESADRHRLAKDGLLEVKRCYERVSETFEKLRELFPFPQGGTPHDPDCMRQAVQLLRKAREDEASGIARIRELLRTLRERSGGSAIAPVQHIALSPFYSFGGNRPKPSNEPSKAGALEAVVCMCASLKESMTFYGKLLGIEPAPERLSGPVGFLPLRDARLLVLMDRRLDLNHADWQPAFYIRVPDVDKAYDDARRQGWKIVNFLDKGGLFTDFFIAADPDGHQLIVGSHSLSHAFPFAGAAPARHPLAFDAGPAVVAAKNPIASARAYADLFGPDEAGRWFRFADKYGPDSSFKLRFETADADQAYRLIRKCDMTVAQAAEDGAAGIRRWILRDPDGRPLAVDVVRS
ncbi:sigma-70 family RNA polymerase sigma factor [Paenibacillus sp. GYB003]|uniref:sigma-70 family RNA polymerase sigma factor n=1 Tax=Paenibacillus sp. GYB003 TaxID=2994392 RepID=UPI002F96C00E